MARGDGTGPMGMGPMTGRAAGFCAGFNMPGYQNQMSGRGGGMGLGRGGGRGWRNRFFPAGMSTWQQPGGTMPEMSQDQKVAALKNQAEYLQESLEAIHKQIKELKVDK